MLDKIRAHARGELPADHVPQLGKGFDGRTVRFLGLKYDDVVAQVKAGRSDQEVLEWVLQNGRKPSEEEMEVWNEFMRKAGWNDGVSETLERRKKESSLTDRDDIQTMFQYIDVDEGRELRGVKG